MAFVNTASTLDFLNNFPLIETPSSEFPPLDSDLDIPPLDEETLDFLNKTPALEAENVGRPTYAEIVAGICPDFLAPEKIVGQTIPEDMSYWIEMGWMVEAIFSTETKEKPERLVNMMEGRLGEPCAEDDEEARRTEPLPKRNLKRVAFVPQAESVKRQKKELSEEVFRVTAVVNVRCGANGTEVCVKFTGYPVPEWQDLHTAATEYPELVARYFLKAMTKRFGEQQWKTTADPPAPKDKKLKADRVAGHRFVKDGNVTNMQFAVKFRGVPTPMWRNLSETADKYPGYLHRYLLKLSRK